MWGGILAPVSGVFWQRRKYIINDMETVLLSLMIGRGENEDKFKGLKWGEFKVKFKSLSCRFKSLKQSLNEGYLSFYLYTCLFEYRPLNKLCKM